MAIRLAIPILVAVVAAGGARVAAPRAAFAPCVEPGAKAESLNRTSALDREREAQSIARSRGRVFRRGDSLFLRLSSGAPRAFVDCTLSWQNYVRYVYEVSGPKNNGLIVYITMGEPSNWFWFDELRDSAHVLHGLPLYNRDSTRFASTNSDLESEYTTNALEVWRVSGSSIIREFSMTGGNHGFVAREFVGDSMLTLAITTLRPDFSEDSVPARLVRRPSGWSLHLAAGEP